MHACPTLRPRRPRAARAVARAALVAAGLTGSLLVAAAPAGATPADGAPFGSLDQMTATPTGVRVRGWVTDPDSGRSTSVHVYVDGVPRSALPADQRRPDVAAAFPAYGAEHGFDGEVPAAHGVRQVCVYGIDNGGAGYNVLLGCRSVQVGRSPFGTVDQVRPRPGGIIVTGWAFDPDTPAPIALHTYVNGRYQGSATADGHRPDVDAVYGNGAGHGFEVPVDVPPGQHQVCVYGIDGTGDANALIACGPVILTGNAFGHVAEATAVEGGLRVRGWALDPDRADPTSVHVYLNGVATAALPADRPSTEIGATFAAYGTGHGFDGVVPAPPGGLAGAQLCVYFINVAGTPGGNLGVCRQL